MTFVETFVSNETKSIIPFLSFYLFVLSDEPRAHDGVGKEFLFHLSLNSLENPEADAEISIKRSEMNSK